MKYKYTHVFNHKYILKNCKINTKIELDNMLEDVEL